MTGRPRDALGRPLPWDAVGVEAIPDAVRGPEETLALAADLLAAGRPFAAHEVFEWRWKSCPDAERDLWQGLAQLAVGITHLGRGNPVGAARLLERGASRIDAHAASGGDCYGLDLPTLAAQARGRAAASEA